jgi:hypothetical protein
LACLCGETSARLWVIDHPEPPLDDADDPVDGLDQIERVKAAEWRTLH